MQSRCHLLHGKIYNISSVGSYRDFFLYSVLFLVLICSQRRALDTCVSYIKRRSFIQEGAFWGLSSQAMKLSSPKTWVQGQLMEISSLNVFPFILAYKQVTGTPISSIINVSAILAIYIEKVFRGQGHMKGQNCSSLIQQVKPSQIEWLC